MEIVVAKSAGFCFGVENAVKKAHEALENSKGKEIYSYGPLIHNDEVIRELESRGLEIIETLDDERLENSTIIIRAHGVSKEEEEKLKSINCQIIDATCPYVKKIHKLVEKEKAEGNTIIIIGDRQHPEVMGINGWVNNSAIIISSLEEAEKFDFPDEKYTIVCQTTFNRQLFEEIKEIFKKYFDKLKIFDTICIATSLRQNETKEIASLVDLMVVIGGYNSSNTKKLYEISQSLCPNVIHIESAKEMSLHDIEKINIVGVTAGASTPEWIIREVIGIMSDDLKSIENEEVVEEVEETVEEIVEETTELITEEEVNTEEEISEVEEVEEVAEEVEVEEVVETEVEEAEVKVEENTFAQMLEESLTTITSGEIVKGPINKIDIKGVYIDLGFKYEGFISIDEFAEVPGFEIENLNIGDEVEAMVVKVSDKDGEAILSKRRVDYKKNLQLLEDSFENKTPVNVRFTEVVKGGLIAHLGTIRVFVPGSQISDRFVRDIGKFVGKTEDIVIVNFEKGPRGKMRIVGSRKILVEAEREGKEEAFWSKIVDGETYKGKVKTFTPFGAFVDLGGYDGLIHLSELSWNRIRHPQEVLEIGQEVEVVVLESDRETKRISLGYRKIEDNPWHDAENLYQVGDIIEVTVVRFVKFGLFVNIAEGIDGLVHISQISNKRIERAEDCLKLGQKVMAKIIDTNIEEKRINLSIRDVMPYDPEPKEGEEENLDRGERKPRRKDKRQRKSESGQFSENENNQGPKDSRLASAEQAPSTSTIGDILGAQMQELEALADLNNKEKTAEVEEVVEKVEE